MNALSIFVNLGDNVHIEETKVHNIECVDLKKFDDITKYKSITNYFPNILEVGKDDTKGLELFLKLTDDINHKLN